MIFSKTFIKITADCVKDGKEVEVSLNHEVFWQNDFSHVTSVRIIHEMMMTIEDQGFAIKEGTSPVLQVKDYSDDKQEAKESKKSDAVDDKQKEIDSKFDAMFSSTTGKGEETKTTTEEQPAKKSRFRL
jgi:hypothetical protein